jgi:tetratricopeptide (TPR) repeat protein
MAAAEQSADESARRWLGPLYNNLAWTYHDRGDFAEALELFRKGVAFREQRPQDAEPLRIARWSVARALRSLGRYDEALAMQRELLAEYERAGKVSGVVFEEIGECLLATGRADDAKAWFAKAYPELLSEGWGKWEPQRVDRVKRLGDVVD